MHTGLIDEFNASVDKGETAGLSIPKTDRALKIDTPPFYGFHPVIPGLNHSLGGLKVTSQAQVLDKDGNPIPGLYAAGSIMNWAFGQPYEIAGITTYQGNYHAGFTSGLPVALVFGRIAGKTAADEIRRLKAEKPRSNL